MSTLKNDDEPPWFLLHLLLPWDWSSPVSTSPQRWAGTASPNMGSGPTKGRHTAVLLSSVCHFLWQLILMLNSNKAQGSNSRASWSFSEDRPELPAEPQCCSNSHADCKTQTPLGLSAEPSHVLRILLILRWTETAVLPRSSSVFLRCTPNWEEETARQEGISGTHAWWDQSLALWQSVPSPITTAWSTSAFSLSAHPPLLFAFSNRIYGRRKVNIKHVLYRKL